MIIRMSSSAKCASSSSIPLLLLLPLFIIILLFLPLSSSSSSSASLSLRDFAREDVALLYQRLKAGDNPRRRGGGGTRTRHRGRSQQQHNPRNGTAATGRTTVGRHRTTTAPQMNAILTVAPTGATSTSADRIFVTATTIRAVDQQADKRLKDQRIALASVASSASASADASEEDSASVGQIVWVVAIVAVGAFFSAATSIGNALVMLSICVDKKLQTISNYFLFSLAVADLIIGVISIPLMTLYTAAQSWDFGYALCQFWLCIDYMMCNASVMNLLLISFDRYFSVTRPLTYRPKRTTRKALFMIAGSYLLSLLLWPPWIVLWPYLEGRFIVEESALCVVQFLALGNSRNLLNQLVTVGTAAAAFYIPVTLMIVLYYKVYLETQRRQKELRKLQDGQRLFSPTRLAGTSALHSLMLPLAPLIRGLQSTQQPPGSAGPDLLPPGYPVGPLSSLRQTPLGPTKQTKGGLAFFELFGTLQPMSSSTSLKKKERFSLLKFCTGRSQTAADISSLDSLADECGGGGTSNLDSILADTTPVELAKEAESAEADESPEEAMRMMHNTLDTLDLNRTSRPPSVHTYNSIVIIEYPDCNRTGSQQHQRPSVRLSSHAEVASLSARNSVERRSPLIEPKRRPNSEERKRTPPTARKTEETEVRNRRTNLLETKTPVAKARSCPEGVKTTANGTGAGHQLMRKSDIMLLREENMRRSEKERRRNERKQEGKAAKTLSAILCAFILTWTPYNVIVCLEAFYPNSVPSYLFTLSYFLSYINSTINPLCYALCNARFRMTYLRIIRCKWRHHSPHHHHRHHAAAFAESSFGRTSSGKRVLLKRHSRAKANATNN